MTLRYTGLLIAIMMTGAMLLATTTFVARAQSDEPTLQDLEDRIVALEGLVEDLQEDLGDAEDTILSLEDRIDELEEGSSDDDTDEDEDADEPDDAGKGHQDDGTGTILVCHMNKHTLSIGAPALRAHLAHGDSAGACAGTARDDDDTDDSEEEDEEEDDDEEEEQEDDEDDE